MHRAPINLTMVPTFWEPIVMKLLVLRGQIEFYELAVDNTQIQKQNNEISSKKEMPASIFDNNQLYYHFIGWNIKIRYGCSQIQ